MRPETAAKGTELNEEAIHEGANLRAGFA